MIYQSCSIDQVIGRIIRNTRVQDTAYIIDMVEWIPEAMEMMQTRQETIGRYEEVKIRFHKGKLPCGLIYIDAVEHQGHRLPMGNNVRNIAHANAYHYPPANLSEGWTSNVIKYPAPGDQAHLYWSTLTKSNNLPVHGRHYYQIEFGNILTDFSDGEVKIHYRATPTDEKGMPLIPDNSNYKEALYWYVRAKMIGAGFDDTVVKMKECDDKFEFFMARAVAEIDYPSPDEMEHRVNTFARLIPVENYFDNYFRVDHPERMYDPLGPYTNRDFL